MASNVERASLVKYQREARAWPQQQLAIIADVSLRTIQRIEKDGSAAPETLMAIAQAFGMNVGQLTPTAKSKGEASDKKRVHLLPRLTLGSELTYLVAGVDHLQFEHDDDDDQRSVRAMADVLKAFKQDMVRLHDADEAQRPKLEGELSQELKGIDALGYYFFGIRRVIPKLDGEKQSLVSMATFYMSHSRSPRVVRDKATMVVPAVLAEVAQ